MSNILENGLPLGLRFYDALEKQKRWKYTCAQGILHNEFQYTDNCDLPPWQIVRAADPSISIQVTMICADDGSEWDLNTECPDMITDITIATLVYMITSPIRPPMPAADWGRNQDARISSG